MLLTEELALVAIDPDSGRHTIGNREELDARPENEYRPRRCSRRQRAAGRTEAGDGELEARTALVLSMTGSGQLLETVAPHRKTRKRARDRMDHALDTTDLEPWERSSASSSPKPPRWRRAERQP